MSTRIGVVALIAASGLLGQSPTAASGHWSGTIEVPGQPLGIEVDLSRMEDKWQGAISIPAQKLEAFPLSEVTVLAASVGFAMKGVPGTPTFRGTISEDGQTISGEFTQGGGTAPFGMKRTGEAKLAPPAKSTALSKQFVGSWEGTLVAGENRLRLILRLSNAENGAGSGTLVSVDQNGAEIPITTITQEGSHLSFQVRTINGSYTGDLNGGATELTGQWTQGGSTLPLTFTRSKPAEGKK